MQWLVALLSLIGALFGGVFSSIVSNRLSERRADLELIREARIALERWDAARSGPNDIKYPDVDESILKTIEDRLIVIFFDRYFEESYKTKVALGVVRHWDSRIADILDGSDWRIPEDRVDDLRSALKNAEMQAKKWRFKFRPHQKDPRTG